MDAKAEDDEEPTTPTRVLWTYAAYIVVGFAIALVLKDGNLVKNISALKAGCNDISGPDSSKCEGITAVYRISVSMFSFFFIMLLMATKIACCSDVQKFQERWWAVKSLLYMALLVVPFFIHNQVFVVWAYISLFGGGLYILVQVCVWVIFAWEWNSSWISKDETKWRYFLLALTLLFSALGITLLVLGYIWFGSDPNVDVSCNLNTFFLTFTIIETVVILGLTFLSIAKERGASVFTTSVVFILSAVTCWSAMLSGNVDTCNTLPGSESRSGAGFDYVATIVLALSVGSAVVTVGSNVDGEVMAQYGKFHIMACLACMYMAMLFAGWEVTGTPSAASSKIDSTTTSMWVKMVTQWVTNLLYAWTIIGPLVCPERFEDIP